MAGKAKEHSKADEKADKLLAEQAAKVAVHKHESNMHKGSAKTKLPPKGYGR